MRLNSRKRRDRVEPRLTQERGRHEVACGDGASRLLNEPRREEAAEPGAQRAGIGQLKLLGELAGRDALGLRDQRECDALALCELVLLVCLDEQLDALTAAPGRDAASEGCPLVS